MNTSNDYKYSGTGNLEAMAGAVNYNEYLLNLVRRIARNDQLIVDFGAGIGTFAAALGRDGNRILCVEPDPAQAASIRRAGMAVVASIADLDDGSADIVYSFNVLEHIDDDVASLGLIRRKLKAGGRVLIYVPAFKALFTDMDRLVGHVRRYRAGELSDKLRSTGFVVNDARYADSLGFLATLVYKWTDRSQGHIDPRSLSLYDRLVFPLSCLLDRLGLARLFGKNVVVYATAA